MKSILKDSSKQGRKGTRPKLTLRVTFSLDNQGTQKYRQSTQTMSWMDQAASQNQNDTQGTTNQPEGKDRSKVEVFWDEDKEFKRENIHWNNFILVYNPNFQLNCYFCGKCQQSFERVADFGYHCLTECGEISHQNSSHFIFQVADWDLFVKRARSKISQSEQTQITKLNSINLKPTPISQKMQMSQKIPHIPQEIDPIAEKSSSISKMVSVPQQANTNTEKPIPISQKLANTQTLQSRLQSVQEFTQKTLKIWRERDLKYKFIFDKNYKYEYQLIILLNPLAQNLTHSSIKFYRKKCPTFKLQREKCHKTCQIMGNHFYGRCCQINTPDSIFLIMNARLFYAYLYEIDSSIISSKLMDLPYLLYLHDHTSLRQQIEVKFPKLIYFRLFIEMYYHMKETVPTSNDQKIRKATYFIVYYNHQRRFFLKDCEKMLKDQTLYCPCQNLQTPMTYDEFGKHLNQTSQHPQIKLADIFLP